MRPQTVTLQKINNFSLKDLVKQAVPFIEVVNREELVEAGFKYKEEITKIKAELLRNIT